MDPRTTLAVACAVAGGCWALLGLAVVVRRLTFLRSARARDAAPVLRLPGRDEQYGWVALASGEPVKAAEEDEADLDARVLLRRDLESRDPAVRRQAVRALGRLGGRHDWAVDGLVEALTEGLDSPPRVAAELDRLASRVGRRVIPLLGHPSSDVRFYAVRLLARHDPATRQLALGLARDPSPNVRAAALETLRTTPSGDALRSALELLDDPHAHVRAHACRTACAISGVGAARSVISLLADPSWWVRDAARTALVSAGRDVAPTVAEALDHPVPLVQNGAALVLQDLGVVDELIATGAASGLLERIFAAGGEGLRAAAAERARHRPRLLRGSRALPSGAGS